MRSCFFFCSATYDFMTLHPEQPFRWSQNQQPSKSHQAQRGGCGLGFLCFLLTSYAPFVLVDPCTNESLSFYRPWITVFLNLTLCNINYENSYQPCICAYPYYEFCENNKNKNNEFYSCYTGEDYRSKSDRGLTSNGHLCVFYASLF